MKCALWLCRRRVFSAEEIPASFDLAALRGYFLAGSLIEWLEDNGGGQYAKSLRELSENDPALNEKIEKIFCGNIQAKKPDAQNSAKQAAPFVGNTVCNQALPRTAGTSFGSSFWLSTSYKGFGSMRFERNFGSFAQWIYSGSSGYAASYKGFGSAQFGRLFGAFGQWSYGGSFGFATSYKGFGSAHFEKIFGSFGFTTSYKGFGSAQYKHMYGSLSDSSFDRAQLLWERVLRWEQAAQGSFSDGYLPSDEYDRIMLLTLAKCPLDRFGYGIHILYE